MEYYPTIKKKEVLIHATITNLERLYVKSKKSHDSFQERPHVTLFYYAMSRIGQSIVPKQTSRC